MDAFTRAVIAAVQADGTCWLGGTTWHGMAAMRISVSNWSTTEADADLSVAAILRCRDAVAARGRRPDALGSWRPGRMPGERPERPFASPSRSRTASRVEGLPYSPRAGGQPT